MRILGVADTDSYVKWGAGTLNRTPETWDRSLVVIETPFLPTEAQRSAAVDGLQVEAPPVLSLADLTALVEREQPDVVFLSLRGPLIRVVLRAVLGASIRRPVILSGLPGISIPATKKALAFRSQVDLMVLHSKREIREFAELAERLGLSQDFGLGTLPFLQSAEGHGSIVDPLERDEIVFAVQAKVPRVRADRVAIVEWLAECARRNPALRVVLKLRAVGDEKQTHAEHHPYDKLLDELTDRPANLVAESGSMTAHLARAVGLVTVSSTALIEAVAIGIPGIAIDDFGVSRRLINPVFEDSNLFGSSGDVITTGFRHPDPAWLDDNYFHPDAENDWIPAVDALVAARELGPLALKPQRYGRAGGRLRHVWDRKRALGPLDRSLVGYVALVVGYPARTALDIARGTRRIIRRAARRNAEQDPNELLATSPQPRSMSSSSIDLPHVP